MTATLRLDRPAPTAPARQPRPRPRWIGGGLLVSLALHAGLLCLALLGARHYRPVLPPPVAIPATVQLEMSPPGGQPQVAAAVPQPPAKQAEQTVEPATPPAMTAEPKPAAAPKPAEAEPVRPPAETAASQPPAPPMPHQAAVAEQSQSPAQAMTEPATPQAAESSPSQIAAETPPAKAEPRAAARAAEPATARSDTAQAPPAATAAKAAPAPTPASRDHALKFDFASVESDTNALVTGPLVVPPSPDVKYHNRKPSYPPAAVRRGEQGDVILLVYVSPDGLVSAVDVLHSSGFAELDRAAREAVVTWHFLPSIRNGQAVPAQMRLGFEFALD